MAGAFPVNTACSQPSQPESPGGDGCEKLRRHVHEGHGRKRARSDRITRPRMVALTPGLLRSQARRHAPRLRHRSRWPGTGGYRCWPAGVPLAAPFTGSREQAAVERATLLGKPHRSAPGHGVAACQRVSMHAATHSLRAESEAAVNLAAHRSSRSGTTMTATPWTRSPSITRRIRIIGRQAGSAAEHDVSAGRCGDGRESASGQHDCQWA